MTEKNIKSRIVHKHDIEENWLKSSLIPKQGELIIFDRDENYTYERFKIGDGITNVNELPFATDALSGVIDELQAKVDALGNDENSNVLLHVPVITDYPTTISAIITAIEEVGGDITKTTFVSFTGYLSGFVAVKFNHYGGNKYKVECIDINNVTKIYNLENNNVIDVSATRIEDFLDAGAVGGSNLPSCDSTNEGQFLRVVGGVPTWSAIPNAEEATF